jgi:hypothetical protein
VPALSSEDEESSFHGSGSDAKRRGSSSSSGSSSSDSDDVQIVLPDGVSDLVLTVPQIPSDFSASDFTKSHSLKSYNWSASQEGTQETSEMVDE